MHVHTPAHLTLTQGDVGQQFSANKLRNSGCIVGSGSKPLLLTDQLWPSLTLKFKQDTATSLL